MPISLVFIVWMYRAQLLDADSPVHLRSIVGRDGSVVRLTRNMTGYGMVQALDMVTQGAQVTSHKSCAIALHTALTRLTLRFSLNQLSVAAAMDSLKDAPLPCGADPGFPHAQMKR